MESKKGIAYPFKEVVRSFQAKKGGGKADSWACERMRSAVSSTSMIRSNKMSCFVSCDPSHFQFILPNFESEIDPTLQARLPLCASRCDSNRRAANKKRRKAQMEALYKYALEGVVEKTSS